MAAVGLKGSLGDISDQDNYEIDSVDNARVNKDVELEGALPAGIILQQENLRDNEVLLMSLMHRLIRQ